MSTLAALRRGLLVKDGSGRRREGLALGQVAQHGRGGSAEDGLRVDAVGVESGGAEGRGTVGCQRLPGSDARLCMEALLVPAEFCMKTGVMEGWILKSQCEKQCHDLARAFKRAQGETKMLSHTEMWGETRVSRRGFALFMRVLPLSAPPRPRNMRRRGAFSAKLTPPTVLVLIATLLCDSAAT